MSIEDTIGFQDEVPSCAVCGKNVTHGGGFSRVNHKGVMVNLCCPLCLETFQNNPKPYMARLAARDILHGLNPDNGAEKKG